MCWSFRVSITSWLISLVSGLFLLSRGKKNDKVFAVLILTYSSMQLWEALMWLDQKCGKLNKTATILAYFALWSHVLAIGVGLYLEQKVVWPVILGMVFIVASLVLMPKKFQCSKPGSGECHLKWGFHESFYLYVFAAAMVLAMLYIRPIWKAVVVCALFIVSFVLSSMYAKRTVGSFWCFVAAIFSPIFIIINS